MEGETTKIYCTPDYGHCCGGNNDLLAASILNNGNRGMDATSLMAMNGGGFGGNNGLMWLLAFLIFGQNGFGNNGMRGNNAQLAQVQNQLSDNQNSSLIMDAIRGNTTAIGQLSTKLGCDFTAVNNALCDMKAQLAANGVQINYAAERVENAVNMGDCRVIEAVNTCCCNTQKELIRLSGDINLGMCQQTNVLQNGQRDLQVALDKGFGTFGFAFRDQTCQLEKTMNDNTQRIIDKLDANKLEEVQRENFNLRTELSQCKQDDRIEAMLEKRLRGCNCGNRGGCCDGWNY